ncbi:profilin-like [Penaeus japonicus]|uniref:profilin-like n=1 Tax=Penaeus japonicus TaxID=27405 RepID=UPI001C716679|nr:profilin-like [Penaeus japonicus]
MSWDQYVSKQLVETGNVKMGAICGLDGSVWAASPNLNVTQNEAKTIATSIGTDNFSTNGVVLNGEKYVFLSGEEGTVRGRKGKKGVHITKTNTAIIIGLYEEPITPGSCACTVESLADYLKSLNY